MPTKTQPKFKIGDVVDFFCCDYDGDPLIPPAKAVVIDIIREVYYRLWFFEPTDEMPIDDGYKDIFTIDKYLEGSFIKENLGGSFELELCDTKYCSECEYNEKCSHVPDIVRCDISEFGQLRGEGKYNPDVCKQRECRHLWVCGTNRFIQE